jgi:transcriptional regulator with XRE-family HTH domain
MPEEPDELTLPTVIGRAVQQLRIAAGLTQAEFAELLRSSTFLNWNRDTVAATESGRRMPPLDELILLASTFECSLLDLLAGSADIRLGPLQLPSPAMPRSLEAVRQVISGGESLAEMYKERRELLSNVDELLTSPRGQTAMKTVGRRMFLHHPSEIDESAGRRFGVPGRVVQALAEERYGHSLATEQRDRLWTRTPEGASPASLGAIRGHVTRQLFAELEPIVLQRLRDADGDMAELIADAERILKPIEAKDTEDLDVELLVDHSRQASQS